MALRAMRSSRRPGVATRMSVPFSSWSCCLLIDAPPTTWLMRSGVFFTKERRFSPIWFTSSRVGARIRVRQVRFAGRSACFISISMMGRPKAAVLPVPVCARPIRSRPSSSSGMAFA
ncbi:hypothetical protein D3C86_1562360 [compost metagenome]